MFKKFYISCAICVFFLLGAAGQCFSKDLEKLTGVGFNSQLSGFGVDSLSIRYWFSKKMAAEILLGFSLGDDTIFNIGGKILTIVKQEQNLNLYGFAMAGIESYELKIGAVKSNDTSFSAGAGFGTEFFFSDFPNLGFGAEVGFGFSDVNNKSQFGTTAGWLSSVGLRYYL